MQGFSPQKRKTEGFRVDRIDARHSREDERIDEIVENLVDTATTKRLI